MSGPDGVQLNQPIIRVFNTVWNADGATCSGSMQIIITRRGGGQDDDYDDLQAGRSGAAPKSISVIPEEDQESREDDKSVNQVRHPLVYDDLIDHGECYLL